MFASRVASTSLMGLAALGLAACQSLPVTADYNPGESIATCHTYTWAQEHVVNPVNTGQPAAFVNPMNADRLRMAIEGNLAAKGIQPAASPKAADCVVGYAIGSRQIFDDFGAWGESWGWGRHWGGYGGWGYEGPYVHTEGRISLDVFDARSRRPIWHASVNENVAELTGPNAEARINAATAAIFTKFPGVVAAAPPGTGMRSPT